MKFEDPTTIRIDKQLTLLDKFVIRFSKILSKHVKYVIVAGYVSILFGRARSTEDIDILIDKISRGQAFSLFSELDQRGYSCINARTKSTMFEIISSGLAVRFCRKTRMIPNFELKTVKNRLEREVLDNTITAITKAGNLRISGIEVQIAFKEKVLRSEKDLEDARHLEKVFSDHLDRKLLTRYRKRLAH